MNITTAHHHHRQHPHHPHHQHQHQHHHHHHSIICDSQYHYIRYYFESWMPLCCAELRQKFLKEQNAEVQSSKANSLIEVLVSLGSSALWWIISRMMILEMIIGMIRIKMIGTSAVKKVNDIFRILKKRFSRACVSFFHQLQSKSLPQWRRIYTKQIWWELLGEEREDRGEEERREEVRRREARRGEE